MIIMFKIPLNSKSSFCWKAVCYQVLIFHNLSSILFWNHCKHFFIISCGEILLLYTFASHHLPVLMKIRGYSLILCKSFFSKFLQHHYQILLDYLKLFFWEHSYCSLVKKHHQKHEHTSHDPLYFYWCHCLPTTGIAKNFYVFLQPSLSRT